MSDKDRAYRIPPDNPFVKTPGARGEVWAYGMRNPWRMSFDPAKGDLWVGDVGWESMEMIYKVQRGGNYGWSIMEGSQSVDPNGKRGPTPILAPTVEHPHTEALSITGGYVYHGKRHPLLAGKYVYGDYVTGKIWALGYDRQITSHQELMDTALRIICFGVDGTGEMYVVDYDGGVTGWSPIKPAVEKYRSPNGSAKPAYLPIPKRWSLIPACSRTKSRPTAGPMAPPHRVVAVPGREQIDLFERNDPYRGYLKNHFDFRRQRDCQNGILKIEANRSASRRRCSSTQDEWHAYNYVWMTTKPTPSGAQRRPKPRV